MQYTVEWDLTTIPDEVFYSEVGRRRSPKGPRKKVGKKRREFLDKQRATQARYRARLKAKETAQ
jgi:hypothetical protein